MSRSCRFPCVGSEGTNVDGGGAYFLVGYSAGWSRRSLSAVLAIMARVASTVMRFASAARFTTSYVTLTPGLPMSSWASMQPQLRHIDSLRSGARDLARDRHSSGPGLGSGATGHPACADYVPVGLHPYTFEGDDTQDGTAASLWPQGSSPTGATDESRLVSIDKPNLVKT